MARIDLYCQADGGAVKPMHAVNNGPVADRSYEKRGNFTDFAALGIPFVRNHDASLSEAYGAQHVVDVHCIFPNFDRDASDPDAYDFTLTDVYTARILEAGSEVFYRLGSSIEHWARKYGTLKPRDFKKWADICEHIMMHYLEGWADGFTYGIRYWEIWNEPDLDPDGAEDKRTWGGTKLEFFDLYETAAKQLKARFPNCMIGGPAVASSGAWPREFLTEMHRRGVPLDFFSWHIYSPSVERFHKTAGTMRQMLDECGYAGVPCILNEWNYVKDWNDLIGATRVIKGLKGASHAAAVMCSSQADPNIDMLMYYDCRVEKIWNGLFDSETLQPIKGYHAFRAFGELYRLGRAVPAESDTPSVYAAAARSEGRLAVMLTNYDDETPRAAEVTLSLLGIDPAGKRVSVSLLDEAHDLTPVTEKPLSDTTLTVTLAPYATALITIE